MNLWLLIFLIFFLFYKIKTGKTRANFEEIFGDGWDKNEREEQVIKIEQNDQNENSAAVDQIGGEMGTDPIDQQKREMIEKFDVIKEKLREKGKLQRCQTKIERKIGKLLGVSRDKIYKWKKELNLNKIKIMKKSFYEQKKKEFIERIEEFKSLYGQRKQKEFVKELEISEFIFRKWKTELLPQYYKTHNKYSNEDKLRMMKYYFELTERDPKIRDEIIAKHLGIGLSTLRKWKKKFAAISDI